MTGKVKSLFEKLYEGGEDALKAIEKPIVRRGLKFRIRAAYDDATRKIGEKDMAINARMKEMRNLDVNKILGLRIEIKELREAQEELKALYKEYFGKEMPLNDED